jgi:hypothetical protein
MRWLGLALFVALFFAPGCGSDGGSDGGGGSAGATGSGGAGTGGGANACAPSKSLIGSCTYTDSGLDLCAGYYGDTSKAADLETECTTATGDGNGAWSVAACPTTGAEGWCVVDKETAYTTLLGFYSGGQAEVRCQSLANLGIPASFCKG